MDTSPTLDSGQQRFESLLIERGLASEQDLSLAHGRTSEAADLAEWLVAMRLVPEADAYAALAAAFDLEVAELTLTPPNDLAAHVVPEHIARRHHIVPISVDNRTLTFATANPCDPDRDKALQLASGREPRAVIASRSQVLAAIETCYRHLRDLQTLAGMIDGETNHSNSAKLAASRPMTAQPTEQRAKPRVLVTDDERITRMLIKLLLERAHFEVIECTNGLEAVRSASEERPDLVLMDLNMPGMNGFEAIERIRTDAALTALPIVVLTAEEGPDVEHRVLALGADDYLLKPFDAEILVARAKAVLCRQTVAA